MTTPSRRLAATSTLLAAVLIALVTAASALAAAPRSTAPPTLDGTFRQGQTIRTSNGSWENSPTSFTYRWSRCDSQNCIRISGETANSYRLVQADVGKSIVSEVTARNADGSATARSAFSPLVADNVVPQNSSPPRITGTAVVGGTLTADPGTWTGAPTFQFSWLQCDAAGANCVDTSARGRTYGVRSEDVGRTIRVQVRASNNRGATTAVSAQTPVVRASSGGSTGLAVPISSVSLPDRLVSSAVSFAPTAIRNRNDVITLRVRVSDTRNRLVQGALVYATGVPFGLITAMPEVATGSNGVATLQFRPTARLALRRGAVQIFLRIRKPGDDLLAGVSSRRLIQITVQP